MVFVTASSYNSLFFTIYKWIPFVVSTNEGTFVGKKQYNTNAFQEPSIFGVEEPNLLGPKNGRLLKHIGLIHSNH